MWKKPKKDNSKEVRIRITTEHPKWRLENIQYVAESENLLEKVKREVLLENKCVKCGKEMGEHEFYKYQFICPI